MGKRSSGVDDVMDPAPPALMDLLTGAFPPQKAFGYPVSAWSRGLSRFDDVGPVLDQVPAKLDRATVSRLVETLLSESNVAAAFVVAMMWGYGTSNVGPYRTARVLTGGNAAPDAPVSAEVIARLTKAVDVARHDGAVEGYRYLNNDGAIHGLGPAFFTKWLYFITTRGEPHSPTAAPILDALVIAWLQSEAGIRIRPGRTDNFARYVALLQQWGEPTGHTPVEVEERIFRIIRNDAASER